LLKNDTAMITSECMQTEQLTWRYDGTSVELAVDWSGQGPLVLLLPALSSISTRREMPLQQRLCANYRTVSIDWPGFGDRPRPRHSWCPEIYLDFLSYLIGTVLPPLHSVIAAGHPALRLCPPRII
jgi:pimeloyl-ACP methyl ester carboxylesterase